MTDSPLAAGPPPGWYADSPSSPRLRWWDGSAWSDHFQGATEPVSVVDQGRPAAQETPAHTITRAERRAAESATRADAEHPAQPPAELPPPTRAELRARTAAMAAVVAEPVVQAEQVESAERTESPPVPAASATVETAAPRDEPMHAEALAPADPRWSASAAWPVSASVNQPFPDQILDRYPREYRPPPPPVTYRPQPSGYLSTQRTTFVPVPSKNGPATASMVLILISLLGGIATYLWLSLTSPPLAGLVNLAIIALLLSAFLLAIVALVIAVRRPTTKRESVFALVVSFFLIVGVIVLLTMRLISVGAIYGGA